MALSAHGIVLRRTKMPGGRRMLLLLTREHGKISAGAFPPKRGKSAQELVTEPFAYGEFDLLGGRNSYSLSHAEVIRSFYGIGEDPGRYAAASYVMELTARLTPENEPVPEVFDLLLEFLEAVEPRRSRFGTLILAYEIRFLDLLGVGPQRGRCVLCGRRDGLHWFSVADGGLLCTDCRKKREEGGLRRLIYDVDFDMITTVEAFASRPLKTFEKKALNEDLTRRLQRITRDYLSYHLEVGRLKSESLIEAFQDV